MNPVARSLLFVPGARPERFEKAAASGAHEVVLDLEDAVAPAAKEEARKAVADWLACGHRAIVRINAADTSWYDDDLKMMRAAPAARIMLPKADMDSVNLTAGALPGRPIIALLETVQGLMSLHAMCAVSDVVRIAFGSIDFALDSGVADEGEYLTSVRVQIALASRYAGLAAPIDGVSQEFVDEQIMRAEALCSKQLGFGGKLCIHPRQIEPVNQAFQPSDADISWAQRVIDAFNASGGGATSVDGKMIDKPVMQRARLIIAEAGTLESA